MKSLLLVFSLLWLPFAIARGELPSVPKTQPTPTPFVRSSPPPAAPLVPPRGGPWFSVVTNDKGSHYEVYATVENAAPMDVRVEVQGRALKLTVPASKAGEKPAVKFVTLPRTAQARIENVKHERHAVVISIPKVKK